MVGFADTALVYVPNGTDGAYTVLAATLTSSRLVITNSNVVIGGGRVELRMQPKLLWTDIYEMPDTARISVGGKLYNTRAGTYDQLRGPSGAIVYRRVDVQEL